MDMHLSTIVGRLLFHAQTYFSASSWWMEGDKQNCMETNKKKQQPTSTFGSDKKSREIVRKFPECSV